MGKDTRITIDLKDNELYRAVRVAAIDRGTSVTDMVCDVLKDWLRKEESREDLEAYREVKAEPARSLDEFLAEIGESRSELAAQG
ncbi:MAG: plasmid partition protein ParG [Dehalococcoidia bacterium]